MKWEFDNSIPIYLQIIEQIKLEILSGAYAAGTRIPAVRDLAAEASVNPNTMQKALSELEKEGLIYSQRTAGRFITENSALIQEIREDMAKLQIKTFLDKMNLIGYNLNESLQQIKKYSQDTPALTPQETE